MHYTRYSIVLEGYINMNSKVDVLCERLKSLPMTICLHQQVQLFHGNSLEKTVIVRSITESEFIALDKYGEKV